MSITIIDYPRKVRRFLTYDFEWVPGSLDVRVCGVFNGQMYRKYSTVGGFLDGELTSENRGKWFYAHAGGLADIQFVLEELVKRIDDGANFKVKASFSGSSAIIVHVTQGKNAWHFIDSFWLLRASLKEIGKWLGIEKLDPPEMSQAELRNWYATVPMTELVPYNERDCVILWMAIDAFETALLEMGGQLQMTLASSAMHLFRRSYLSQAVHTSDALNDYARQSYFSSRVEIFNRECDDSFYYDVNSSFPYAMTFPCPGNLLRSTKQIPSNGLPFIADVEIEVPDMYLPPVPYRFNNRVFFPTGCWRGWLNNIDVDLLLREGGKLHRVHEVLVFEPFTDLAEYSRDLYEKRRVSTDDFERTAYKLLLNSLYGKFAESSEKSALYLNPEESMSPDDLLFPGAYLVDLSVPIAHAHVPISGHIVARARKTLYDFLGCCQQFDYCDTDGFSTDESLSTDDKLGSLKLEKVLKKGVFVAPKMYMLEKQQGTFDPAKENGIMVKAKGFSLNRKGNEKDQKDTIERFLKLMNYEEIEIERMTRIKELYRKGYTRPEEKKFMKRLRRKVVTKRHMYPDGHTRPWHIREILDPKVRRVLTPRS